MKLKFPEIKCGYYTATAIQLFLPLLLLWLSRFVFAAYNADLTGNPSFWRVLQLSAGGLRFDLSAWAYCNVLFIAMRLLPFGFVSNRIYLAVSNAIWCVTNFAMLAMALGDIPFFRFSGSRLRLPAVADMLHDPNITGIILSYFSNYWWAFTGVLALLIALILTCLLFRNPRKGLIRLNSLPATATVRSAIFLVGAFLTFCAMRGTLGAGRPLSIADAVWYASTPPETNIVLNTPYCVIRSVEGGEKIEKLTFFSPDELDAIRSSVHRPAFPADSFTRKNVMVITIESGSQHWLDSDTLIPGAQPRHLMPFLDSLASVSLVNRHTLATGKRSIEGITAIYGGFPTFGDMLYLSSPYNANRVDSYARLLSDAGYSTRFYFGGNHGSYSIDALLKSMGYNDVYDRETYNDDSVFDGQWGVFDHAMGAYAANDLEFLQQPFAAGWFTLDLHEPFNTPCYWRPDGYRNKEPGPLRSAEYTDRAVRHFFEIARTKPWYANTVFVITGDHGARDFKGTPYDGIYIQPHVMMMIYTPDGSVPPGEITDRVMSQYDIGPTILSLLRYSRPYVALGSDMLDAGAGPYAIGFFNSQYQVTGPDYLITLTDGLKGIDKVYDIRRDPLVTSPTADYDREETGRMLRWARAFMQDYTHRLNDDALHI